MSLEGDTNEGKDHRQDERKRIKRQKQTGRQRDKGSIREPEIWGRKGKGLWKEVIKGKDDKQDEREMI